MTKFWRVSMLTGVVLFLETCAFYLVFSIITTVIHLPEARIPFALVFVTLLWAFLLAFYVQTVRFSLNLRGILGLIASVGSLVLLSNIMTGSGWIPFGAIITGDFITASTVVISFVFLVVLWWRGGHVAQDDVTLDSVRSTFQLGIGVVFLAVIVDAISPNDVTNGFLILAFFGVGLAGLSMARFASESGDTQLMSADWFIPIGITVGGVLLLGLLISLVGLGGLDDVTRAIFAFAGKVGLWILRPVALGIGYLAAAMVLLITWLASLMGGGDLSGLEEAQLRIEQFHESLGEGENNGPPGLLVAFLKWGAFLAATTVTGWILYRLFRFRRLFRRSGEVEETRESLFSWERANRDLSSLIAGWWNNLVGSAGAEGRSSTQPANAREVYHSFLTLSADVGQPKRGEQTPKEHQHVLGWTLPPEPVAHIVDGFQDAHYGHAEPPERQMQGLLQDWGNLQQYVADRQRSSEEEEKGDGK